MDRTKVLRGVLAVVGIPFLATAYPLVTMIRQEPAVSMMLSIYVTLGVFLLLAMRNPAAHRSLIAFTAWSSLAHAGVMGIQAMLGLIDRGELIGVAVLIVIGVALLAVAPPRQLANRSVGG